MDKLERLKRTIQNRLNEARNNGTRVARVMSSTLSEMLEVVNRNIKGNMAEVVKCKDCKHRPIKPNDYDQEGSEGGFDLVFPDWRCPCYCEDKYYSWYPGDEWFCGSGERKDGEQE